MGLSKEAAVYFLLMTAQHNMSEIEDSYLSPLMHL